jgi:hypothetical protein
VSEDLRAALLRRRDELRARLEEVERLLGDPPLRAPHARRGSVKGRVLLALEAASDGLTVEGCLAGDPSLKRATVSSMLSRLKADGVVTHDGRRYAVRKTTPDRK